MMGLDYDPFEFLKEELSSDEIHIKVNAIHRISIIATVIGTERIEKDLIPLLNFMILTESDEILFALAEEIGTLQVYLGDSRIQLLPLLESLASAEEYLVRDQAVVSMIEIAGYLPDYQLIRYFLNSLLKLASSDQFPAKISACKLFLAAYPRAGGYREKLRNKLVELCQDDNYMIRKVAAEQIKELLSVMEKTSILNDIFPIIKILILDDQEEIRIICISFIQQVCLILTKEEIKTLVLPLLSCFQEDKS